MPLTPTPRTPEHDQDGWHRAALLILDTINCFDFEGGEQLEARAIGAAQAIVRLRDEMRARDWPIVYVNDNFGHWHSDSSALVAAAVRGGSRLARILQPSATDYFIIKPQFSGFYATNLPVLLPKLGVRRLILTGVATDICVLFTAADAHMRDYQLWVPCDAVAAESDERSNWALNIMAKAMGANIDSTTELSLDCWRERSEAHCGS
ncbi:cysteine hydrolase family protein [Novosphingobium sp. BL-8A]|uniref:cysteine hydrolase family protein n=1 Tax=Novosphingobium sp. BL-8A TaxID=3127639 RepID=UPI003756BBF1